jgi:NADH-quinone oxidoreductase subunit M
MMLSGIMLKMGVYGVIRWLIPNAPVGFLTWANIAIILSVIGIVYASIIAFKQTDGKRLVAYSSIAHVGLIAAGIFAWNIYGVQGAMIQMVSHGINVVGMFFIWDIISRRLNTRDIDKLGGIAKVAPNFAIAFLIIVLGTVALPLTNGFVGEFLLLRGVFGWDILTAGIAGTTIILGAVYMLRMYKNVMQGELNELTATFTDIKGSEKLALGIICALIIVIGVYPQPLLHISEASVTNLLETVSHKFITTKF